MQARRLKKILNNTNYNISNHPEYIAVGSPLCHDLIKVDKKTLKVSYALDAFNEGRKLLEKKYPPSDNELLFIWDKLHELIKTGEIQDIINGKDHIENPLPVFTVKDGQLIESITDAYGWPNTDENGNCMYNNTHFGTREAAIQNGIETYESERKFYLEKIGETIQKLSDQKKQLDLCESYLQNLRSLKQTAGDCGETLLNP